MDSLKQVQYWASSSNVLSRITAVADDKDGLGLVTGGDVSDLHFPRALGGGKLAREDRSYGLAGGEMRVRSGKERRWRKK